MTSFRDFFKIQTGTQKRHMHPIGRDVSSHPKHAGRFVPHMHRAKLENNKFKRVKAGHSKREMLTKQDIKDLRKLYKFDLNPNHPIKLGNTGISIVFDKSRYFLVK